MTDISVSSTAPQQRMSKQRRAILDDLEAHPIFRNARDIHTSLEKAGGSAGLATVYRNLQVLEEAGLVDGVRSESGEMLYRACADDEHHHHLMCSQCGRAEEVELDGMELAIQELASRHGYQLLDHTLELVGLCEQCRDDQEGEG